MPFHKFTGAAVVLTFAIPAIITAAAFGVTTLGSGSICLPEADWSHAADKIAGAKRYIEQHPSPDSRRQSATVAGFDLPSCCKIDKGDAETPTLSLPAFVMHGKTHYVHVPMPDTFDAGGRQTTSLVTVDGCGNGISAGWDM